MNFEKQIIDAAGGATRTTIYAIAVAALIAAGFALQLQLQGDAVARVQISGASQQAERPAVRSTTVQYSVSKSQPYCPVSPGDAREGAGQSLCSMLWGGNNLLGAIANSGPVRWAQDTAGRGFSKLKPAIRLVADSCLPFLN